MEITRSGFASYHGDKSIHLHEPDIYWNPDAHIFVFHSKGISDFNTTARHDYFVSVSSSEFSEMLSRLFDSLETEYHLVARTILEKHADEMRRFLATLTPPYVVKRTQDET